ncbi:hypothetical protein AB838_15025 [Rhodobacteraceae bacterium (ex Bugula neritina AB1)]|nr:hypothetical protein AB838_15025 [Rhodobacteraceae bacterium (ex Bugula neritina AB1)]
MIPRDSRKPIRGSKWLRTALPRLRNHLNALLLGILLPAGAFAQSAESVQLWSYHNFPPFVTDLTAEQGLTFDLAAELTRRSAGKFIFEVTVLPRFRLNEFLSQDLPGLVPWVNPIWFADRDQTRYLWSRQIMQDRNSVISPAGSPVDYSGPESLDGMVLAAVQGHRYSGVQDLIEQGRVTRTDLRSEKSLVQFVAAGRGSVAILATSALDYYLQDADLQEQLAVSRRPHATYHRHIMTQKDLPHVHAFVESVMDELMQSGAWQDTLQEYGARSQADLPQ